MEYQVLARKYRPRTFKDVIAQEHVTTTLSNAITAGRIGSSYLFCGPRGTGKTSVARILARSINCVDGPTVTPCEKCDSCLSIGLESSVDVREIDAASNTSVDDVRTLRENVRYGPSVDNRKRIYIIDEVHRLSGPAFDALLKTLEEPPAHAMFIFATTDPQKVPDTIRSRTQRFDFRRVGVNDLVVLLKSIASEEGFTVTAGALRLIARRGEGSVRDAIFLLDQLLSFSEGEITEKLIEGAFGLVDRSFLFKFLDTLAAADSGEALTQISELSDSGSDLLEFAQSLRELYRCLTILKATSTDKAQNILDLTPDEMEQYQSRLEHHTLGDLVRISDILSETLGSMKEHDARWMFEIGAIKIAHLESTIRLEEVLAFVETAQTGAQPGLVGESNRPGKSADDLFESRPNTARAPEKNRPLTSSSPAVSSPQTPTAPTPSTGEFSNEEVRRVNLPQVEKSWNGFIASLRGANRMIASQLAMATVRTVKDNHLIASFPSSAASNRTLLEKSPHRRQVQIALEQYFATPMEITFETEQAPAGQAGGADPIDRVDSGASVPVTTKPPERPVGETELAVDKELANNPDLQEVVKKVNGEILSIRRID